MDMTLNKRNINALFHGDRYEKTTAVLTMLMTFAVLSFVISVIGEYSQGGIERFLNETAVIKHIPAAVLTAIFTFLKIT